MDPTVTVGCVSPVEKHCLKCDLVELSGLNYLQNLGFFFQKHVIRKRNASFRFPYTRSKFKQNSWFTWHLWCCFELVSMTEWRLILVWTFCSMFEFLQQKKIFQKSRKTEEISWFCCELQLTIGKRFKNLMLFCKCSVLSCQM